MSALRFVLVALVLVMTCACASPITPGPLPDPGPNPGPNPGPSNAIPWSQLPPISDKAKQTVVEYNINIALPGGPAGTTKRWELPIAVFGEPGIIGSNLARATDLWKSKLRKTPFRIVATKEEAQVVLDNIWEPQPSWPTQICGVTMWPRLAGGVASENAVHFAFLAKPAWCPSYPDGIRDVIAHELGHVLMIIGHPNNGDLMSVTDRSSGELISSATAEAVNWTHDDRVPGGTKPVE